jgi:asparagine synthase (glutamine-hydrolysing)
MSASSSGSAPPWLEACLGGGASARLQAGGLQAFGGEHRPGEALIAGFGRLRLLDDDHAALARGDGMAAALRQAWRRHGEALPAHLDGEYAVALWDPGRGCGLFAVDRFASQPLYWGEHGGRLAVATRPARVCALLGLEAALDLRAVHAFVHFHVIPAPLSIHRGVSRLDLGAALRVEGARATALRVWQPRFEEPEAFDAAAAREGFLDALRQAVAESADGVPDPGLGCFLSGGTDSSTIAGLLARSRARPVRTFSIVFDRASHDERQWSRLAAAHFGTDHHEHLLAPAQAEAMLDAIATAFEQPFGNASAVPTLACARIAREAGVTRLLGGDGGDELYGGNERYATQWLFAQYARLPSAARERLLEPLLFGPLGETDAWLLRKARSYIEQARLPLPDRLGARHNLLNLFGAESVLADDVLAAAFDPLAFEREVWSRCDAAATLNRLLAYDFKFTLADSDLPKVTRMCHAAGLEVAFPMLAHPVCEHSLRLPAGQKLRGRRLRHFFRESLRGFLPDAIIDKPKHGFGMPFGDWLLTQPKLADRAHDALFGLERRGLLRRGFGSRLHRELRHGHAGYYGTMVWVLMSLELWIRAQAEARQPMAEAL